VTTSCPIDRIVKRDGSVVRYDRERIATAVFQALNSMGRPDLERAASLAVKVERALVAAYGGGDRLPTVEDIQDVVESVLMEEGLTDVAREYIIYRHQRAMARAARAYTFEVADFVPYRKIYEVLRWNIDHGCDSVRGLNRIVRSGAFPAFVRAVDARYEEEAGLAAQGILRNLGAIRLVIVAGPSSSGKTTTTLKIAERLRRAGATFHAVNIDHYFFNLEDHPRDEFGDYDYETPQALDLELINRHLQALLAGETVRTPHYDFKTGRRELDVHPMRLRDNEILLVDSLHGLHADMTASVPEANKYRVYVETLGQVKSDDGALMRWADNRLLRRMQRDRRYRNLQPLQTLTHWHYVRRSELQNIIPYIHTADVIVNTALPYELPILRRRLFRTISSARRSFADDARRRDAYIRANRIYDLLKPMRGVRDDTCVSPTSLLREFIGGSAYTY